jgi:hypothetical protein
MPILSPPAIDTSKVICDFLKSAFSSEVVFSITTSDNKSYIGVAPKHYAQYDGELSKSPLRGTLKIKLLEINKKVSKIELPDGEKICISSNIFSEK